MGILKKITEQPPTTMNTTAASMLMTGPATGQTSPTRPIKVTVGRLQLEQKMKGLATDCHIPHRLEEGGVSKEGDVVVSMGGRHDGLLEMGFRSNNSCFYAPQAMRTDHPLSTNHGPPPYLGIPTDERGSRTI